MYSYLLNEVPEYNQPDTERQNFVRSWALSHDFKIMLDVGCGKGHYIKALKEFDIDGLDPYSEIKGIIKKSIVDFRPDRKYDAFYCVDVLEHIEEKDLAENLKALSTFAPVGLLGIANHSDIWDGVELHPIQQNAEWWTEALSPYFKVKLLQNGTRYFIFEVQRV